jgi:hypothetical protein
MDNPPPLFLKHFQQQEPMKDGGGPNLLDGILNLCYLNHIYRRSQSN